MTAMTPPEVDPPARFVAARGVRRWWWLAVALAVPKCVLCLALYFGLGAVLGLGGPELCGATESSHGAFLIIALFVVLAAIAGARFWPVRARGKLPSRQK